MFRLQISHGTTLSIRNAYVDGDEIGINAQHVVHRPIYWEIHTCLFRTPRPCALLCETVRSMLVRGKTSDNKLQSLRVATMRALLMTLRGNSLVEAFSCPL